VAVAFDAVGPSSAGQSATATTTLTWSHTCSGTNRYVLVGVSMGQNPDTSRTMSATFGGTSMTSLGLVHSGGSTAGLVQLFGLVNPAAGASTVTVTASGTTDTLSGGSMSFTGVDQTTPVGTAVTASGTGTALSATVASTTTGNMVAGTACTGTSTGITAVGNTSRWVKNVNGNTGAGNNAGETAAAGGSVSMTFTSGASDFWGVVAVEVKAAATGGGTATFTVGKTSAGSTSSPSSTDKLAVSQFTASSGNSGTLTSGGAHVWLSAAGSSATRMVVYADSSGAPGTKLAESAEVTITQTSDVEVGYTFSGGNQITITDSVTYWIGVYWQDPGTPSINIGRDATILSTATPPGRYEQSGAGVTYPTAPSPFGTGTAQSGPIAAYVTVTYTTSGGGGGGTNPVVRSTATGGDFDSTSTSHTVTKPTGLAAGDYLVVLEGGDADSVLGNKSTTLSGLSTLSSQAADAVNNIPPLRISGKVATSTDASATSWTFSDTSSADACTIIIAIQTGTYDTTTPITVGTWTTQPRPPGSTQQSAPSMTGVANALLLAIYQTDTANTTESYPSGSPPSGMTLTAQVQGGPHFSMTGAYQQVLTVAGATGAKTVTPTGATTSNGWSATQIMVNPGASTVDTTDFFFANV
jgi:hypothetical protein